MIHEQSMHGSWKEPVLSILPASLWQSIDFSISRNCCQRCPHRENSVAAHPIRLGYRCDALPLPSSGRISVYATATIRQRCWQVLTDSTPFNSSRDLFTRVGWINSAPPRVAPIVRLACACQGRPLRVSTSDSARRAEDGGPLTPRAVEAKQASLC